MLPIVHSLPRSKSTAALLLLAGALALASPLAGAGSDMDRKIERAARSSYNFRAILDKQVEVKSENGAVTLTGVVRDQQQKILAETTVRELPGVVSVENNIETSAPMHERADGWIALKIRGLLVLRSEVSARQTSVAVDDGVVTLQGIAESPEQKALTESIARGVQGVKEVHNQITLRNATASDAPAIARETPSDHPGFVPTPAAAADVPSASEPAPAATDATTTPPSASSETVEDQNLAVQVKHTLVESGVSDALHAQIETRDGEIVIRGLARSESEKDRISRIARRVPGVAAVTNEMSVGASE